MTSKIQEEINLEYAKFEKKVKPLRDKLRQNRRVDLSKVLSEHKGIIYKKNYGKNYCVLKILKTLTKSGRLKYTTITIEEQRDYSINYVRERNNISKKEAMDLLKLTLSTGNLEKKK